MDPIIIFDLIGLVILIYLSGRFSGSETALTSLSKVELAQMRLNEEKNVEIIAKFKSNMDRAIITILIGNNLVNVTASALATKLAYDVMGNIGIPVAVIALTVVLVIFGEVTPKGFAIKNKKYISKRNAKLIYYLSLILKPFINLLESLSDYLIALFGGTTQDEKMKIQESDIRNLATILEEQGLIKKIEREILHRVFFFGDLKVKTVKVSEDNTFLLDADCPVTRASRTIQQSGFTRIPVVKKNDSTNIVGVLYSKDIIGQDEGTIKEFMKQPYIVHDNDDITKVFKAFQKKRIHMAIVQDRNGNFAGIITLEDIIEELVGEIYDEYD